MLQRNRWGQQSLLFGRMWACYWVWVIGLWTPVSSITRGCAGTWELGINWSSLSALTGNWLLRIGKWSMFGRVSTWILMVFGFVWLVENFWCIIHEVLSNAFIMLEITSTIYTVRKQRTNASSLWISVNYPCFCQISPILTWETDLSFIPSEIWD